MATKPKQLLLLLDGTWDDADIGPCDSNIVRLRELINLSLTGETVPSGAGQFAASRKYDTDEMQRLIFCERGVGTGALRDRILGGAFGSGLDRNVRRAYRFLSWYYEDGDPVFIFGFSRGAYTARSLVGMIACSGLLKRASCNADLEEKAWTLYRTPVNDRLAADFDALTPHVHDRPTFKVTCVGVFDTVGALGVPLPIFFRANRDRYGFHNVDLGSITETSLHALAIDEHREPFQPAPWRRPKFQAFMSKMTIEQVWFPGAHGDVGGGYTPELDRTIKQGEKWERRASLDDITLDWMLKRVLAKYPDFPVKLEAQIWAGVEDRWAKAEQHEARIGPYWLRPFVLRPINNYAGHAESWPRHAPFLVEDQFVGYDRHAEPLGEMIHISALARYGERVLADGSHHIYAPRNLRAILPYVGATYGLAGTEGLSLLRPILVVDWTGEPLDPADPAARSQVADLFFERSRIKADLVAGLKNVIETTSRFEPAS